MRIEWDLSPIYEEGENAIKAKLRELGWVKLEDGQVVADIWCYKCGVKYRECGVREHLGRLRVLTPRWLKAVKKK